MALIMSFARQKVRLQGEISIGHIFEHRKSLKKE